MSFMKKLVILYSFIFLCFNQITFAQPTVEWSKSFGNSSFDKPNDIVLLKDGYFIVGTTSKDGKKCGTILFVNHEGDKIYEEIVEDKHNMQFLKIHELSGEGSFNIKIIAEVDNGKKKKYRNYNFNIKEHKLSLRNKINLPSKYSAHSFVSNDDIYTLVASNWTKSPKDHIHVSVSEIYYDEIGWTKDFDLQYEETVIDFSLTADKKRYALLTASSRKYKLRIFDAYGKYEETDFFEGIDFKNTNLSKLIVRSDGSMIAAGGEYIDGLTIPVIYIFDKKGKLLKRQLWNVEDKVERFIEQIMLDQDENLIVVGHTERYPDPEAEADLNLWLAKVDKDGKMIWEKEIGGTAYDYAINLTLNQKNEIILVGTTVYDSGKDSDITVTSLIDKNNKFTKPEVYALIVGVSEYSGQQRLRGWRNLRYCDDDALKYYNFLKSDAGGALNNDHVSLLLNEKATLENIQKELKVLFDKARTNDLVIFYFSGHGGPNVFAAHDGQLEHEIVKNIFKSSAAKYKICIADACYSDSYSTDKEKKSDMLNSTDQKELYYQALRQAGDGLATFMSSAKNEVSLERFNLQQGVFSYYFIEGLKGDADYDKNKIITIFELYQYVSKHVVEDTKKQHPQLRGMFDHDMPIGVLR
jgi:hypothetical protein